MQALYGSKINLHSTHITLNWCSILREMHQLKVKGFDFMSLCSKKVGDGNNTNFWFDIWKGESNLQDTFPRMFALETDKQSTVAAKIAQVDGSFRRPVRGSLEQDQFNELISFIDSVSLSFSQDGWVCNASGDGSFRVKDIRNLIDDLILPSWSEPTRWVKFIPIKINIFIWRARRDCLPTRSNLVRRGVFVDSNACPICGSYEEDIHHILFQCDLAQAVLRRICRCSDYSKNMSNKRPSITRKPVEGPPRELLRCDEDTIQESQSPNCEGKDCAKIIKKQSKPDNIEHEIAKITQKPDQRTFSVQVNKPKVKIASIRAKAANL
nr:RNA-directed DNA polymerase, eukaryota [Tanacetum cinerariifolium]